MDFPSVSTIKAEQEQKLTYIYYYYFCTTSTMLFSLSALKTLFNVISPWNIELAGSLKNLAMFHFLKLQSAFLFGDMGQLFPLLHLVSWTHHLPVSAPAPFRASSVNSCGSADSTKHRGATLFLHPCRNQLLHGWLTFLRWTRCNSYLEEIKATSYLTIQKTYSPCPDRKYLLVEPSKKM